MAYTYGPISKCQTASGSATTVYEVRLGYELQSQDLINNTSVIKLRLEARSTNSKYHPYGYTQSTYINGSFIRSGTFDFQSTNTWQVFGTSDNITVNHSSDGTYSTAKSGYFTTSCTGDRPTRGDASVTVTLPTIPRASSFTISKTNGGSSATEFTLGETLYVNITRASSSFTHKVYYYVGNSSSQNISNNAGTSCNSTLPVNLSNYIPSTSSTATIYVDTYNGSTKIGSASKTFTLYVPSNVVPSISSIATSDTNGYLSTFGAYVQGKSTLKIQTTASGSYGSSIQSCIVQIKSGTTVLHSLSGTNVSIPNISYTGNLTISVTVTDSRGRPTTSTASITVLAYSNPQVSISAVRNSSTPTTVSVSISANIVALNNHNTKSFTLKYKKTTASSWTTVSLSNSNYSLSTSQTLTNIDENSSYDMQLIAADYFTSSSSSTVLGTVEDLVNYKSDGSAIAFGKISELTGYFENNLLSKFFKDVLIAASLNVTGNLQKNGSNVALASQIPTVNNGTLTIQKNGSTIDSFTANSSSNKTINVTVPTNNNELVNGRGFITSSDVATYGSNSNGYYVRFPGIKLQICWCRLDSDVITIPANSVSNVRTFTFPAAFSSTPFVLTQLASGSSSATVGYIQHSPWEVTTSDFKYRTFSKDSTNRTPGIGYIAIGFYS